MSIDLTELQNAAGQYVTRYNLIVAAGPMTAATVARVAMGKNKLVNIAVAGSGAWFAVKELSGPMLGLMQDQFGTLSSLASGFRH